MPEGIPLIIVGRMVGRFWTDPRRVVVGLILIRRRTVEVMFRGYQVEIVRDKDGLTRARDTVMARIAKAELDGKKIREEISNIEAMVSEIENIPTLHVPAMTSVLDSPDGEYVGRIGDEFTRIVPDPSRYGDASYVLYSDHGLCIHVKATVSSGRRVLWRGCDEEGTYVLGSGKRVRPSGYGNKISTTNDLDKVRKWALDSLKRARLRLQGIRKELRLSKDMLWEVDQGLYRNINVF